MNIPKYPEDFFSFAEGYDVPNNIINEWIKTKIKQLEENPNLPYSLISSGNTSVRVDRLYDEDGKYEINVIKNYSQAYIY